LAATVTTAFYYKCDGGERTKLEGRNAKNWIEKGKKRRRKNWSKRKRKHNEKRGVLNVQYEIYVV
jgi:hypothetical protein